MDHTNTPSNILPNSEHAPAFTLSNDPADVTLIGSGMRAKVERVVSIENGKRKPMALKTFNDPQRALAAREGYETLEARLPRSQMSHLIQNVTFDVENGRMLMPVLNEECYVVSMGKNSSLDRDELEKNKLKNLKNFPAFLTNILNAIDECSQSIFAVGPDVYFFSVDRKTGKLDYLFADMETASEKHGLKEHQIARMNLYWVGGALHEFLTTCVENPKIELDLLRMEIKRRMHSYDLVYADVGNDAAEFEKEFAWPALTWKERLRSVGHHIYMSIMDYVRKSWKEG